MAREETPIYHRSRSVVEPVGVESATPTAVPSAVPSPSGTSADELSDAPVVVDLPDGQKVILGSISPGTVIEIAAWRGTERPDSRTTRIVLGVANNPVLEEGIPVSNSVKPERRRSRAWIWFVAVVVVLGAAVLGLMLSPLKFVHPTSGISLGFGEAKSSVILVAPIDSVESGQLVVANKGDDVVVGQVGGVDSGQVLLQTGSTFTQVKESAVFGSVVVIIPFIGLAY